MEVPSRHLPGETEKDQEKPLLRTASCPGHDLIGRSCGEGGVVRLPWATIKAAKYIFSNKNIFSAPTNFKLLSQINENSVNNVDFFKGSQLLLQATIVITRPGAKQPSYTTAPKSPSYATAPRQPSYVTAPKPPSYATAPNLTTSLLPNNPATPLLPGNLTTPLLPDNLTTPLLPNNLATPLLQT